MYYSKCITASSSVQFSSVTSFCTRHYAWKDVK